MKTLVVLLATSSSFLPHLPGINFRSSSSLANEEIRPQKRADLFSPEDWDEEFGVDPLMTAANKMAIEKITSSRVEKAESTRRMTVASPPLPCFPSCPATRCQRCIDLDRRDTSLATKKK